MILVGSLFSGIGGIELGLERTGGFKTIWFVENDKYCQRVLRKHWPEVPIYGDIKAVDFTELKRPDMLTGGFPCQPVSVAGKKKGEEDPRWLWPEYARAIRQIRPRIVLVENVPGLYQRGFSAVLGDLAESRYDAEWDCLPAAAFGAPHLRYRIFLVAYSASRSSSEQECKCEEVGRSEIIKRNGENGIMADPDLSRGRKKSVSKQRIKDPAKFGDDGETQSLADSNSLRGNSRTWLSDVGRTRLPDTDGSCGSRADARGKNVADSSSSRQPKIFRHIFSRQPYSQRSSWWEVEPSVGRVVDGLPNRVDRLRVLGNAVVPQIAEYIGNMILADLQI